MKITVLAENTTKNPELIPEHGLSLFIQTEQRRILFDMGQTDAFAINAEKLGIDLSVVDAAVLSHGHYDHGGGIRTFLKKNGSAPIYLSRRAFGGHYHGSEKYIGLDKNLMQSDRLHFVDDSLWIDERLALFSCNKEMRVHPTESFGLEVCIDGTHYPEEFLHEQYLLIREGSRRILISGCSHKGILNIVDWFRPDVLVGGFHFMKLDPESEEGRAKLTNAAEELLRSPTMYYTGHCTGETQFNYLKEIMGDRLAYLSTGCTIDV